MRSRILVFVFLVATLLSGGCGNTNLAPVKGRVTCNGKPVAEAMITFAPFPKSEGDREAGKPATGFTDDEGNYELSTYKPYDGALIGKHNVTITLDDTNPARCKREIRITLEVQPKANELNIELNQ
jgi:hypothetical protein